MWSASLMFSPSAKVLDDSISCASAQLWVARRWSCGTFKSKQALVLRDIQEQAGAGPAGRAHTKPGEARPALALASKEALGAANRSDDAVKPAVKRSSMWRRRSR